MSMECEYCGEELTYDDYYGTGIPERDGFQKMGDIYKCTNEECDEYGQYYHTDKYDDIHEGYPC